MILNSITSQLISRQENNQYRIYASSKARKACSGVVIQETDSQQQCEIRGHELTCHQKLIQSAPNSLDEMCQIGQVTVMHICNILNFCQTLNYFLGFSKRTHFKKKQFTALLQSSSKNFVLQSFTQHFCPPKFGQSYVKHEAPSRNIHLQ